MLLDYESFGHDSRVWIDDVCFRQCRVTMNTKNHRVHNEPFVFIVFPRVLCDPALVRAKGNSEFIITSF